MRGLQLSSAYDRRAEARLQAQRVPSFAHAATIYGLGLGDLVRELCTRRELKSLRLVLFDPGVAKLGFALVDQSDWLEDPRLELALARDEAKLERPFAAVPPALQLAEDAALVLRDEVGAALQAGFVAERWKQRLEVLESHIAANEDLVAAAGDVASVFGRAAGGRAIVVGPGPTLADHIELLQAHRKGAELVVISTALAPVLAADLVPDFVVMIDSHSIQPFDPADARAVERLSTVPLVFVPEVQRATLEAWPGPRLAAYLARPRFAELAARHPRAELWTDGTVAHTAVDLAAKLGAQRIELFGLDFSYPGGASHAPGTPDYQAQHAIDQGRTVINGYGERVASDPNLISYLRDLEAFVKRHPSIAFTRAGQSAAALEGVPWIQH